MITLPTTDTVIAFPDKDSAVWTHCCKGSTTFHVQQQDTSQSKAIDGMVAWLSWPAIDDNALYVKPLRSMAG